MRVFEMNYCVRRYTNQWLMDLSIYPLVIIEEQTYYVIFILNFIIIYFIFSFTCFITNHSGVLQFNLRFVSPSL